MNGVSKISSEQNVMLITFQDAEYSAKSLGSYLSLFAQQGIVVDMISQSAPRGAAMDFSFTAGYDNFPAVMKVLPGVSGKRAPLISVGYSKINLFGEEMVTTCGVAARALSALGAQEIEVFLITTSDLDISLLVRSENEDDAIAALSKEFSL